MASGPCLTLQSRLFYLNPDILCFSHTEQLEVSECPRPFRHSLTLLPLNGLNFTPILPFNLSRLNLGIIFFESLVSSPRLGVDVPPMNSRSHRAYPCYRIYHTLLSIIHKSINQGSVCALALSPQAKNGDCIFKVLGKKKNV